MVAWLSPAEMSAWRSYIDTYSDLASALEHDLLEQGVGLGDYQVLVFLSEADGRSMRMCDLADRLQLSPSGLTRRLDGLVRAGAVVRRGSKDDRRVMMAVLTDEGFATLERVAPHHVASVRHRIFDRLDESQVAALESIFTAIGDGLPRRPVVAVRDVEAAAALARGIAEIGGHDFLVVCVVEPDGAVVATVDGFRVLAESIDHADAATLKDRVRAVVRSARTL